MSISLGFPGLMLFVLCGLWELCWIAPTSSDRDQRAAAGIGWGLILSGAALYALGMVLGGK